MALHYKLNPLFESISGTISRKRFPDGHVETSLKLRLARLRAPHLYSATPYSTLSPYQNNLGSYLTTFGRLFYSGGPIILKEYFDWGVVGRWSRDGNVETPN